MATINLRDFYPWYTHDEFVEVPDVVARELFADRRYGKSHQQRMRRNKSYYSLDVKDGIETAAICSPMTQEAALMFMEQHCRLCMALNSLPKIQGRRIEAYFILGQSIQEIAEAEGTGERNVRKSISRGLEEMKKHIKKFD